MGRKATYGLIGYPLSHSLSKQLFEEEFFSKSARVSYELFPLRSLDSFQAWTEAHPHVMGLQVTIPYKEAVMKYLCRVDGVAQKIGAVNTLKRTDKGWGGYNTDSGGFWDSFKQLCSGERVLVLGSGGAAKAVRHALASQRVPNRLVSRQVGKGDVTYAHFLSNPERIQDYDTLVNATPLGMYPHIHTCPPLPYDHLLPKQKLCDLIYNPEETLFLKLGAQKGCETKNGWEMLRCQARRSWTIWQDEKASE